MSTEQENLEKVKKDGLAIKFIEDPSEVVQLVAEKRNKDAYKNFKDEWFK